jgi:hypothetical protein
VATNETFVYFEADYSIIRLRYNKGFVSRGFGKFSFISEFLKLYTHCREQRKDFVGKMVHHH